MKIRNVSLGAFVVFAISFFASPGEAQQSRAVQHFAQKLQQRAFAPVAPRASAPNQNWQPRPNQPTNLQQGRVTEGYNRRDGYSSQTRTFAQSQNFSQRPLSGQQNGRYRGGPSETWSARSGGASAYAFHQPGLRNPYPIFNQVERVRSGFLGVRVPIGRGSYHVVPFESYRGGYLDELYGGIYRGRGRYNWGVQVLLSFGGGLGVGWYQPYGPWRYCNGYRWWNPRTYRWVSVQVNAGYGYDGVLVNPDLFMYSEWYEDLESGIWYDAEGYSQPYTPPLPPGARYGVLVPEDVQTGTDDSGEPIVRHVKVMQTEVVPGDYAWGGPLTAYDTFSQVYINIPIRRRW